MTTLKIDEQNINPSNIWCHDMKPSKFYYQKLLMQRRNTNRKINNVKYHIGIVWKGQMFKPKVIIMGGLDVFIFQFHQSLMIKLKWHMWPSSAKIMLKLHFDIMTSSRLVFQLTTLENIFFKWKFIMQHLRFQSIKWDMSRKLVK